MNGRKWIENGVVPVHLDRSTDIPIAKQNKPRDVEKGFEFGVVVGKHERGVDRWRHPCGQDQDVDGKRH